MAHPLDGSLHRPIAGQANQSKVTWLAPAIAAGLSLIWVIVVVSYALSSSPDWAALLFALALPLALIWVAALSLRRINALRNETQSLQAHINELQANLVQAQSAATRAALSRAQAEAPAKPAATAPATATPSHSPAAPRAEPKLTAQQGSTQQGSAQQTSGHMPSQSAPPLQSSAASASSHPQEEQGDLGFDTPSAATPAPLALHDFIRAAQFPENADDAEGFRALRLALEDREIAKLIRSTQDVLTLLSQEGVYMDDLPPELCHPDLWRRFAHGERGRAVAAVGGIRDRASLAITSARMREDTIFRDVAHHFLRTFDKTLQSVEPSASDQDLIALADTRTARAFMLVGRVAGVFD